MNFVHIVASVGNFKAHHSVDHSKKEYCRGIVHVNFADSYFSLLKRVQSLVLFIMYQMNTKRVIWLNLTSGGIIEKYLIEKERLKH